ncbi:glycosyltransferase [Jiangella muralis]|uniref:glycosyltransferase n=1 Tax=Jiangella muralis TaxID=702383 RepID=UPI00069F02E5|nr:glycosyltransferase [Jiangella muralis]
MVMTARRAAAVRNDWRSLTPRPVGEPAVDGVSVTVVIPAHDCQPELELALAALDEQSHPNDLLDIVVVDDRSQPPLVLPGDLRVPARVIRVEGGGHGSGNARDVGARVATGDVLLFLDADIIADRHHVEAHARWHELIDDAVVLGFRDFVDVEGVTPAQVREAVAGDGVTRAVAGRAMEPHSWIEQLLAKTDDLVQDREDLWRAVVGASVSTRRSFYDEMGGFPHFPRRGIVDTEFGYRCFTAGGVVIPERAAYSLHQGQRSFASRGDEIARLRAPLIANHIAHPRYRPSVRGRQWAVPYLHVIVPAGSADFVTAQRTVDDLLANDYDDLTISVVGVADHPEWDLLVDYWERDGRVKLMHEAPRTGFPSPATMLVPVGARFASDAVGRMVTKLRAWTHGLLSVSVTGMDTPVELWATRALSRSLRAADAGSLRDTARSLFGEAWSAGSDHGVGVDAGASDVERNGRRRQPGR